MCATSQSTDSRYDRTWWAVAAVLAFGVVVRAPGLFEYLAWDEGIYAYISDSMLKGVVPYRDIAVDKEPGIFFLYAAVLKAFGPSSFAVRAVGAAFVIAAASVIYRLGSLIGGRTAGLAGAFFYCLGMGGVNNCGMRTNSEVFMTLFSVLTYLFAYLYTEKYRNMYLLLAGLFAGLGLSLKLSAVMDAAGAVVFVTAVWWSRPRGEGLKPLLQGLVAFAAGWAAGILPSAIYVLSFGAAGDAWHSIITYRLENLGSAAADRTSPFSRLKATYIPILIDEAGAYIAALAAVVYSVIFRRDKRLLLIAVWLLFSFAAVSMTGRYLPYYFPLMVPPVALAAGYGVSIVCSGHGRQAAYTVVLFLILSTGIFVYHNLGYFERFVSATAAFASGRKTSTEFHRVLQPDVADIYEAAAYVGERTEPSDTVYYWINDGSFYWQTGRRPASRVLSPLLPNRGGEEESELKARVALDIAANRPRYIAVRDAVMSYLIRPFRSTDELDPFPKLRRIIDHDYTLEKVVGRLLLYRRVGPGELPDETKVLFPEFMATTVGYLDTGEWLMYTSGRLTADFSLSRGRVCTITVKARGIPAGGVGPHMVAELDGSDAAGFTVGISEAEYSLTRQVQPGRHKIVLKYDNDAIVGGEDRDLYVSHIVVRCGPESGRAD